MKSRSTEEVSLPTFALTGNEVLDAALDYAERGWPVHPLNGKRPRLKNWPERASTDAEEIREWWEKWPTANVGIVTGERSGLIVIDVDGPEGEAALTEILGNERAFTLGARTGKGRHLYFEYDPDVPTLTDFRAKVDVRSDGGQVVAPPSIHPDTGEPYGME